MIKVWVVTMDGDARTQRPVNALARPIQALLGGPHECQVERIKLEKPEKQWDHTLSRDEWIGLLTKEGVTSDNCPDIVLTAHQNMGGPIGLAIKEISGGHTKIVQIQSPNAEGLPHYDLDKFDVIVRQPHERIESFGDAPNVIATKLAVHDLTPERLAVLREQAQDLTPPIYQPMLAVMLGGNDVGLTITADDMTVFGKEVAKLSQSFGTVRVVPMGRTSDEQLEAFKAQVTHLPHVHIDKKNYDQILAAADAIITSGEGSLLGAEDAATGKPASVYFYGDKIEALPLWTQGTWPDAFAAGNLARFPEFSKPNDGTQENIIALAKEIIGRLGYQVAGEAPAL